MYNQITLIGHLGSEVELRYTPTGTPVCTFRMATNDVWTKDGQKQEKVVWHRITMWRVNAENAAKYLGKGDQVMVVGKTEMPSAYLNKNNEASAQNEVTGDTIKYLKTKKNASNGDESGAHAMASEAQGKKTDNGDIPF